MKKLSLGVMLLPGIVVLVYAMDRRHNHGATVKTAYVSGEILSAVSGHGTQFIVKLDDAAETTMVYDSVLLPLPAGTKVPLERREFTDGTIKYAIVHRP